MRFRTAFFSVVVLLGAMGAARAQEEEPSGEQVRFHDDGGIETGGVLVRYWQVNHEEPANLARELALYVGNDVKLAPKSQNVLRIEAPVSKWPVIEKLLEVLDVPAPQVYVEAKIIELRHGTNLEFGFEATYDRRAATGAAQPFFGKFTGTFNPESYLQSLGTTAPFQGGTFEFERVGRSVAEKGELEYVLRALGERGSAEILSQPSILASQGKKATIVTGQRFPVQSVDVQGSQTIVTTKFETTGIKLEITPQLVGRDAVELLIHAEDSQVTERIAGPQGSLNPVISERTASTEMSVRDGETVVIGGLLHSSTIESRAGLPLLMDIPLLGHVFSSTRTQEVKAELVFFLNVRVVSRKEQTVIVPPGERSRVSR